jgi:capsular polysaccharide biosynthesis protein
MSGYLGMDLPGFIALVRSRARLIGAIVAAAVVLALVLSLFQSSRYRATADLLFGPSPAAEALDSSLGDTSDDIPERVAATNLALASLDGVAARVKDELGTPASVEDLKAAVEVQTAGDSDIGTVTAEWDSAEGAARVANAFAGQIVAIRAEASRADLQRAIDALSGVLAAQPPDAPPASTRALRDRISTLQALAAVDSGGVRVVEPASPPLERSSPRPLRNAVIAGFVALVLALLLVVVLARIEERVPDEEQLAALVRAPVLARIPAAHDEAALDEAFEFLRLNLQMVRPRARGGVAYVITSAKPGEGKTVVTSGLARALGMGGAEVVAVDHDVRKPELDPYLNPFDELADDAPDTLPDDGGAELSANWRRAYGDEDIEAALTELALCDGNARRAARALKATGLYVSESTLRRW